MGDITDIHFHDIRILNTGTKLVQAVYLTISYLTKSSLRVSTGLELAQSPHFVVSVLTTDQTNIILLYHY